MLESVNTSCTDIPSHQGLVVSAAVGRAAATGEAARGAAAGAATAAVAFSVRSDAPPVSTAEVLRGGFDIESIATTEAIVKKITINKTKTEFILVVIYTALTKTLRCFIFAFLHETASAGSPSSRAFTTRKRDKATQKSLCQLGKLQKWAWASRTEKAVEC